MSLIKFILLLNGPDTTCSANMFVMTTQNLLIFASCQKLSPLMFRPLIVVLKQVAALKQLTKAELIQFFDEHIKAGAPQKKSLSVQVYATAQSTEKDDSDCNMVNIDDVFTFRRSRPLYGSFKGGIGHVKL